MKVALVQLAYGDDPVAYATVAGFSRLIGVQRTVPPT